MEHLIRLELKKFGVGRNIMFTVAAILFSILFITVSLVDSMTDPEQTKDTFESTFLVIGLLVSSIFLVYSSVLTARFVIGEYDRRTIILLFSYPLNRKGLIAGKMMIIMVYTAVSVMMGYICCTGFMIIARTPTGGCYCRHSVHDTVGLAVYHWHDPQIRFGDDSILYDRRCISPDYNK